MERAKFIHKEISTYVHRMSAKRQSQIEINSLSASKWEAIIISILICTQNHKCFPANAVSTNHMRITFCPELWKNALLVSQ